VIAVPRARTLNRAQMAKSVELARTRANTIRDARLRPSRGAAASETATPRSP
jgi:hypothetical protein